MHKSSLYFGRFTFHFFPILVPLISNTNVAKMPTASLSDGRHWSTPWQCSKQIHILCDGLLHIMKWNIPTFSRGGIQYHHYIQYINPRHTIMYIILGWNSCEFPALIINQVVHSLWSPNVHVCSAFHRQMGTPAPRELQHLAGYFAFHCAN